MGSRRCPGCLLTGVLDWAALGVRTRGLDLILPSAVRLEATATGLVDRDRGRSDPYGPPSLECYDRPQNLGR
ncbi:hypothetical protein VULLAG_LOCUS6820 [Vulpes lagopus]